MKISNIILLVLFSPFICFSQQKKKDSASINKVVRKIGELSKANCRKFTRYQGIGKNKIKEVWQYFDNKEFSRIVIDYTIDSIQYSVTYSEKYYIANNALLY